MTPDHLELAKWAIGLPAAVIAVITIPYVMRKLYLECTKLKYEIRHLQRQLGERDTERLQATPGTLFTWFAHYWPIPCYGSLAVLVPVALLLKSAIIGGVALALNFILFVSGSVVDDRYRQIMAERPGQQTHTTKDRDA